jgi:ABC-type spermidine/putrescine transport system permease subunit II
LHLRLDLHPRRARAAGAPRLAGLGEPRLINTPFAVLPGIVYGYLPLMVFPIHVSLERLDRRLLEASMDLYATPWATFRQATLPQLLPAIAASFLLAFAFSFNDFVIVFFVAGPNTTLPISILASIRRGATPERRRQRA